MDLFFPRYASPTNPDRIIPPSPPAETRERNWREIERQMRSYSGRMPHVIVPGYEEPVLPARVILPGDSRYRNAVQAMVCMPTGLGSLRIPQKPMGTPAIVANINGYWTFNNTPGNLVDSSGNGTTLTNNSATFSTGKIGAGQAAYFSGTSQWMTAPGNSFTNGPGVSQNWGIALWYFMSSASADYGVIDKGPNTTSDDYSIVTFGGTMTLGFEGSGKPQAQINIAVPTAGAWHWICWNIQGGNGTSGGAAQAFSDSDTVQAGSVSPNNGVNVGNNGPNNTLIIGARGKTTSPFSQSYLNGRIDGFGIKAGNLTQTERTNVWNGGNGADWI